MFVFCGLITEAYYVHCLGGVDWLGGVHEEQGRQPAGGLVQHCGCTEWLCQLEPVTAGGARELPQFKLQVSLVQKFKIQFWVMTLKNWTQCTLHLSMRVVVQRDFSIYSPNRLDAWVEEVSTHCEGCFVWGPDADLPQGWGAQCIVDPLCRLKLFLNAKPILTEPVTAGGARELQAGREGGWQFVHGHRWKGRSLLKRFNVNLKCILFGRRGRI